MSEMTIEQKAKCWDELKENSKYMLERYNLNEGVSALLLIMELLEQKHKNDGG